MRKQILRMTLTQILKKKNQNIYQNEKENCFMSEIFNCSVTIFIFKTVGILPKCYVDYECK